ncbi:MAG TPA: redox-regulated ATPase YchF [Candidatus Levybacteria bacterium]|nr:redox-regulated ATPase YchF [Candidatus Levybacteria bacterium]
MNISVGIIGLPNVGKSTLFNALLKKQAALAANYPFATIEPNTGIVPVPDDRLNTLAEITKAEEGMSELPPIKQALVEFVDIAGLVKGASEGAGLGNKFLSHIREVKIVAHVVRVFEDSDVIKEGAVDPKSDYETIRYELLLADLQTLTNINEKSLRTDAVKKSAVEKLTKELSAGKNAFEVSLTDEEKESVKELNLLSDKNEIIVLNVSEGEYTEENIPKVIDQYASMMQMPKEKFVVISAKIEAELAELGEEDAKEYLNELGVQQSGLTRLIQNAYENLGLISFFTAGEKEVRAWTTKVGANAVEAAGEIHTDFMQKFIKAEVVAFADFVEYNGWKGARENGKARNEGRDYTMQDGDVVEFKIGR